MVIIRYIRYVMWSEACFRWGFGETPPLGGVKEGVSLGNPTRS
jgi:hypothetical protein